MLAKIALPLYRYADGLPLKAILWNFKTAPSEQHRRRRYGGKGEEEAHEQQREGFGFNSFPRGLGDVATASEQVGKEQKRSESVAMLFGNAVIASGSLRCRARGNRTEASAVRAGEKRSGKPPKADKHASTTPEAVKR